MIMRIFDDGSPDQAPAVTPVIEQNAVRKVLPLCGHDNHVVLARGRFEGFGPMKFERFPLFLGQTKQQPFGPLKTEAAFTGAPC